MAEEGISLPVRLDVTKAKADVNEIADTIKSLRDVLKGQTDSATIDLVDITIAQVTRRYKDEIKKAGEEAVKAAKEAGASDEDAEAERGPAEKAKMKSLDPRYSAMSDAADIVKATTPSSMDKEVMGLMKDMSSSLKSISDSAIKFTKQIFSIVEDVYKEMRNASPLLQTIESLFNLAWQLFFMPLGNKLGEMLIPAVVHLVEQVTAIWEQFEGKTLGEMLGIAIREGVSIIAGYFKEIGNILSDDTGVVKEIGQMLKALGTFIDKNGVKLLNLVMKLVTFVIDHIGIIIIGVMEAMVTSISLLAGIKMAMMMNHIAMILFLSTALATISLGTSAAAGGAIAAGATTAAANIAGSAATSAAIPSIVSMTTTGVGVAAGNAGMAYLGVFDVASLATGGHQDAVPGGSLVRIAEGGEGEWVIPDSKMSNLLSGEPVPELGLMPEFGTSVMPTMSVTNNYDTVSRIGNVGGPVVVNLNITGYTDEDLGDKIVRKLNEEMNLSVLRSGLS